MSSTITFENLLQLRLRNAPPALKSLALGFVFALSMAYVYAMGNIFLVVGLTPDAIATHYYGAAATVQSTVEKSTQEEEVNLDEIDETTKPLIGPRPSFKNLVAEGHFHLFGMTSFFFGLTVLGLFTSVPDRYKAVLLGLPYLSIVADNLSFMATRFLGPRFAYLTAISGTFMVICFSLLWMAIVFEIFSKPNSRSQVST